MTFVRTMLLALAVVATASMLTTESIEATDSQSLNQIPASLSAETEQQIGLESGSKGQKYCNRPDKSAKYKVNCPVPAPVAPPTNPAPAPTDPANCVPTAKPMCPSCNIPPPQPTNGMPSGGEPSRNPPNRGPRRKGNSSGSGSDSSNGKGHGKGKGNSSGSGSDSSNGKGHGHGRY